MGLAAKRWDGTPEEIALAAFEGMRAGEPRPPELSLSGLSLAEVDLSGLDLCGCDLSGCDLSRADLSGARLMKANLENVTMFEAKLSGADFSGACMKGAHLIGCSAKHAGFGFADLSGAELMSGDFEHASFTSANLTGADLRATRCHSARFRESTLTNTDFTGADLQYADLSASSAHGALFRQTDLRHSALTEIHGYKDADWVRADIRESNFVGAYLLRRFIQDQNYLEEFRGQDATHEWIYRIWWATSDCGRSIVRWGFVTGAVALVYAVVYTHVGIDYGPNATVLSPLYFSIVTLTTLGYGDVLPSDLTGQIVVITQVIIGYLMLGGLLSIVSNKVARRAD